MRTLEAYWMATACTSARVQYNFAALFRFASPSLTTSARVHSLSGRPPMPYHRLHKLCGKPSVGRTALQFHHLHNDECWWVGNAKYFNIDTVNNAAQAYLEVLQQGVSAGEASSPEPVQGAWIWLHCGMRHAQQFRLQQNQRDHHPNPHSAGSPEPPVYHPLQLDLLRCGLRVYIRRQQREARVEQSRGHQYTIRCSSIWRAEVDIFVAPNFAFTVERSN